MALSLLEMKDHRLSTPSQESRCRQTGDRADRRKNINLPQGEPWVKVSPPQTARETDLEKSTHVYKYNTETLGTSQTVCVSTLSGSISKQDKFEQGYQKMNEGTLNQSEKPKRSKNRRQRRKGPCQQIVGLPCSPSAPPPVLLWFRRDLRLRDNPALICSLEFGASVIPVFIWSPEEEERPGNTVAMGGACKLTEESVITAIFVKARRIIAITFHTEHNL